jgi:hypothetical protein
MLGIYFLVQLHLCGIVSASIWYQLRVEKTSGFGIGMWYDLRHRQDWEVIFSGSIFGLPPNPNQVVLRLADAKVPVQAEVLKNPDESATDWGVI